jgi:hypothetical protein
MAQIRTEAWIDADPQAVWAVLADFGRYAEWNPLNLTAAGEAKLGARVDMTFLNLASHGGSTIRQTVIVTTCEPGRSLAWTGHIPLLFGGRHFFELEPARDGTNVRHGEDFRGLIAMTFSAGRLARDFTPAYEEVNRALAERVAAIRS